MLGQCYVNCSLASFHGEFLRKTDFVWPPHCFGPYQVNYDQKSSFDRSINFQRHQSIHGKKIGESGI